MLKRLIEVALPLKEVSEQSAREKSIRHGHISTLHIWWARRPLAACRAVVFASLIPDPDDAECPESFRQLVRTVLGDGRYKPKGENGGVVEDTPRARVLEFIKHLVKWENSNEPEIIEPARKLVAAAHKFLHPDSKDPAPKVLDPFAGGGAIPLEALRLGCEAHAIDINPVAHLIELCTLVYPQKFGRPLPKDAPLPPYIERLIAHNKARGRTGADEHPLFEQPPAGGRGGNGGTGVPPVIEPKVTRRNLPHIQCPGSTYFITWRCQDHSMLAPEERTITLDAIRHWHGVKWDVVAAVVMPDHVHVLGTPLPKEGGFCDLSEILHSIKSFSSHEIGKLRKRHGNIWLDESFDRVVRDEKELQEKYNYIRNNPVKNGLAARSQDYPWLIDQEGHRPEAGATTKGTGIHGGTGVPPVASQESTGQRPVPPEDDPIPDVEITAAEYRRNPLAADVRYWGHWVLARARKELAQFYPPDPDGAVPVAYLWARTVKCPNPACGATIPLVRQLWLCNRPGRKVALRLFTEGGGTGVPPVVHTKATGQRPVPPDLDTKHCRFEVVEGKEIDFDPSRGTMQKGKAMCPFCQTVVGGEGLRTESKAGRMGQQMMAVVTTRSGQSGKTYRTATKTDVEAYGQAADALQGVLAANGATLIPDEPMTPDRPSPNSRGLSGVVRYGLHSFGDLFNTRQKLAVLTFVANVKRALRIQQEAANAERTKAVTTYLALAIDRLAENGSSVCRWNGNAEKLQGTFGRQALPMVWDYCEASPLGGSVGCWDSLVGNQINGFAKSCFESDSSPLVRQGSADRLPQQDNDFDSVVTDPPYYDAVPYSDLSDFFYVWLKRSVGDVYPDLFRTPLTPKAQELIAYYGPGKRKVNKPPEWYEAGMAKAFAEMYRTLNADGIAAVMFAHKTTTAWESVIGGLIGSGLLVTSSWPLHTEMKTRMVARNAAALASSVTLVCRKRPASAGEGLWDDVRQELAKVVSGYKENGRQVEGRLDFFWNQGIRGADFFISAIGPALSVFGRYERVVRTSGEPVTVSQFLDEVRSLVTAYALAKIMKTGKTGAIDAETLFYVVWRWSYGGGKVPADEAFKLAQALRLETDSMWDRTGVLEKAGENVLAMPIENRTRIKDLGEPQADGRPASVIDALHRLCALRDKGDTPGMAEFLARSGHARNETLWVVAQAISEILPDGDKEKQLMQGLLASRDRLAELAREAGQLPGMAQ
jgi:adenine-specific DNA methylase/REP element-mobilizing transposase RayT